MSALPLSPASSSATNEAACSFDGPQASRKRDQLKIKPLVTIRSPNRVRPLEESLAQTRIERMLKKGDLVETVSRDLARARNKRDTLASGVITLTAEIAVLEASLLTENDRRERERAASEIERFKKQVNDQYLAFVPTIAGIRGSTEIAAAIVPKARELDELLLATANEVGNAIGDLLSDLDRRIEALRLSQPKQPQSFKEIG